MKRERDSQRSKVYSAEEAVFCDLPADHPAKRRYPEMADLAARVDAIWQSATVSKMLRYGRISKRRPRRVADGRGKSAGRASADGWSLSFTRGSRVEWVILHELAHTIHCNLPYGDEEAWHGHQFCSIYLKLVRRFIGREAYDALRLSFKKHRVRYTPKKKLSAERLAQLREQGRRLAACRNPESN